MAGGAGSWWGWWLVDHMDTRYNEKYQEHAFTEKYKKSHIYHKQNTKRVKAVLSSRLTPFKYLLFRFFINLSLE